jgi:hypothetical protein
MSWKFKDEEDPSSNGFYVVWRSADEGEDHPPAEWDGIEEWRNGAWAEGDWGVVMWWDQCFTTSAEAEAAAVPEPTPDNTTGKSLE